MLVGIVAAIASVGVSAFASRIETWLMFAAALACQAYATHAAARAKGLRAVAICAAVIGFFVLLMFPPVWGLHVGGLRHAHQLFNIGHVH